jgi:hypothetical protein
VEPLAVADVLDDGSDPAAGIDHVTIGAAVDLFLVQGLHEALHLGVVVRAADPAPGASP